MRLYKYLSISSDDDTSVFRSLNLDLVEESTGNLELVKRVTEQYYLGDTVVQLLDKANKELKMMYRGRLKFDFCLDEQGMVPGDVKIDKKKQKQLKDKWFRFNNELSEIQIDFEKSLQK